MSKVFNQVIKDGVAVPVWDDKAHAEISAVSAGISGHLNDNVKHISNADREKWNAKVDPSALNDYTYFSSFSSHSANDTVHVTEPDRIKWNAKVDPSAIADMATTAWVEGKGYLTAHQDLSEYATTAWVDEQHYLTAHQDLSDYATSSWVTAQGYLTAHQDLSEYATTAWVDEQNYLTAHQDLSEYATSSWVTAQGYLTAHQDLSEYAKSAWVTAQGYLTAHQSLAEYATSSWVTAQGYLTAHQDLSDYATTAWVEDKGYLTAHQSLENYYTKNETSGAEQIAGALNDKANESDLSAFELEYRAYISGISGAIASGTAASAWLEESASQLATTADVNDLEQAFNEYVSGISADIASGVAASAWIDTSASLLALKSELPIVSAGDNINVSATTVEDTAQPLYIISGHSPVELFSNNESVKIKTGHETDPDRYPEENSQVINVEVNLPEAEYGFYKSNEFTFTSPGAWETVPLVPVNAMVPVDADGVIGDDSLPKDQAHRLLNSNVLYHCDLNVVFERDASKLAPVYETVKIKDLNKTGHQEFAVGALDASTTQRQFFNLSYDFKGQNFYHLYAQVESEGWKMTVVMLNLHDVNGGIAPGSTEIMAEELAITAEKVEAITTTVDSRIITNMPYAMLNTAIDGFTGSETSIIGTLTTPVMTVEVKDGAKMGVFMTRADFAGSNPTIACAIYEFNEGTGNLDWVANTDWTTLASGKAGFHEMEIKHKRDIPILYASKMYYFMIVFPNGASFQAGAFGGGPAVIQLNVSPMLVALKTNMQGISLTGELTTLPKTLTGLNQSGSSYNYFITFRNNDEEENDA